MSGGLTGFLLGAVVGNSLFDWRPSSASFAPAALALTLGASILWFYHLRSYRWVILGAGALWGVTHAAPSPLRAVDDAKVVATSTSCGGSGPILVATQEGVRQVFGLRSLDARGSIITQTGPRPFGRARGFFRPTIEIRGSGGVFCGRGVGPLKHNILSRIQHASGPWAGFYRGLVIGEAGSLSAAISRDFKRVGLYHLLIVSGLHITIMAWLFGAILGLPLRLAYAVRIIRARTWRRVDRVQVVCTALLACVYLFATGASAATQRSCLLFLVHSLGRATWGAVPLELRLLAAASAQVVFFPLGILSEGNAMSWLAYLLVVQLGRRMRQLSWLGRFAAILRTQATLLAATGAFFGQWPWLGLVTNFLLVPVFPLLLLAAVVVAITDHHEVISAALSLTQAFVGVVHWIAHWCDVFPWLYVTSDILGASLRCLSFAVTIGAALIVIRDLTIRGAMRDDRSESIQGKASEVDDGGEAVDRSKGPDR